MCSFAVLQAVVYAKEYKAVAMGKFVLPTPVRETSTRSCSCDRSVRS